MRKTMAQQVTDEMTEKGFEKVGQTSGWCSFRKGSNLSRKLEQLSLTKDDVEVRTAARAGKNLNDGWQLLIFKEVK